VVYFVFLHFALSLLTNSRNPQTKFINIQLPVLKAKQDHHPVYPRPWEA